MEHKSLINHIQEHNIEKLAIVGLAKNSGKTVTLNTIIEEAKKKFKLALLSYGRDGEKIDAVTLQKKPRIKIPCGSIFVTTTEAYEKSNLDAELIYKTNHKTLFGKLNIYKNVSYEEKIELIGLNSSHLLAKVETLIENKYELLLIDGALDRKSSAIPSLADGLIIATGAVIANTIQNVVDKTNTEVCKFSLPLIEDMGLKLKAEKLFQEGKNGIIDEKDEVTYLSSETSFGSIKDLNNYPKNSNIMLILNGALTNSFFETLVYKLGYENLDLIVKDATKVFLNSRNFNLMGKYDINLKVVHDTKLLAITVNPVSPYGIKLNSGKLLNKLRREFKEIPVYNVMSQEYSNLKEND